MAKSKAAFGPKDRIAHTIFGTGTIIDVNERHTTIAFDESGTRKFITNMVQLGNTDTPAPSRPVRKKKVAPAEIAAKKAKKAAAEAAKVAKKAARKAAKKVAKKPAKKATKKATKKAAAKKPVKKATKKATKKAAKKKA